MDTEKIDIEKIRKTTADKRKKLAEIARSKQKTGNCMSTEPVILAANEITKSYPMGQVRLQVLKGIDMEVHRGEFIAIIGASGSGKSTLLHILGALDKPDSGTVEFEGRDLSSLSAGKLNQFRNESVGFVFQFYHLLDEMSVLENVMLPAMAGCSVLGWLKKSKIAKKRAFELLHRVGMTERAGHKPYQLSGGERQRTAIARALMNEPKLLLADEPTGNLDSETGNGILRIFDELGETGQTIVMVTHDEKIADRANMTIKLVDGRVRQ